jgi:hypothetical protein
MIKGAPSPWLNLPLEKIKEMKDRYKLINDIEREKQREEQLKKDKLDAEGQTQMDAMKDTLPFLDRG